jgi:hypothetical protein
MQANNHTAQTTFGAQETTESEFKEALVATDLEMPINLSISIRSVD